MTESVGSWGKIIEKTINQGREDRSSKFIKMKNQFDQKYEKFTHCSHIMIYARTKAEFETFPKKAHILMQMRFDGYIGFPGGIVDKNETPLEAVRREVKEEMGWNEEEAILESDYQFSHVDNENELVLHFYVTEVSEAKFKDIELKLPKALDYGKEALGHFTVPLYIMGDAFRGFPAFLRNHFVGNAKLQLIEAILNLGLLTEEQITQALYSAPRITY